MIYTTFEQTDYGFVLLDINKKQSDINWFRKVKIFKYELLRTVTVESSEEGNNLSKSIIIKYKINNKK